MRIETNTSLIQRNRKIANYLSLFSLAILVAGFVLVNPQIAGSITEDVLTGTLLSTSILIVAFICTPIAVRMTNKWVREPRPETVLPDSLKGLGRKSALYSYYHGDAPHVLIAPQGVFAIVTRYQNKTVTVDGDQWTTQQSLVGTLAGIFRLDSIGNPSRDALKAAEHAKTLFASIAPDVEVRPLIVFIDSRAKLTVNNPTVPVVYADSKLKPNLKEYLKSRTTNKNQDADDAAASLTPEQISAFEEATLEQ